MIISNLPASLNQPKRGGEGLVGRGNRRESTILPLSLSLAGSIARSGDKLSGIEANRGSMRGNTSTSRCFTAATS